MWGLVHGATILIHLLQIMIPIPQYPLYTATLSLNAAVPVPYYLSEESNWGFNDTELERAIQNTKSDVRALCVINPGNPTGNILGLEDMKGVVRFCYRHGIALLADEVYQVSCRLLSIFFFP